MVSEGHGTLGAAYDVAMLDLDGVVYIGGRAVDGAAAAIAAARTGGLRVVFITNNAARTPDEVASHLCELGVEARGDDVVTSSQAAAAVVRDRELGPAYVLGSPALAAALSEAGVPQADAVQDARAVVSGFGPDVVWKDIMRAAVAIRDGLPWVASNTDLTFPSDFGIAPGHGTQVRMISEFSGVEPVVAGKPEAPLFAATVERTAAKHPLMVGDRLDTDIEGARKAGVDSLLVMTGVTGLRDLVSATTGQRPTYVAADLGALCRAVPTPERVGDAWSSGGWTARIHEGSLEVAGSGEADDWWRVAALAAWQWLDDTGEVVSVEGLSAPNAPGR